MTDPAPTATDRAAGRPAAADRAAEPVGGSGTGRPAMPAASDRPVADRLRARITRLTDALDRAGDRVDPEAAAAARARCAELLDRLELGVDHAVVALVGGTGSGKSSLFNQIATLEVAEVGPLRPTTEEPTACVWGPDASGLLDFLLVEPGRRVTRESLLDASDEELLHGLVLLDLPDHDSRSESNQKIVERMLPLVDVLVWVVDPQKYADHVLHDNYLTHLRGREEHMLVVVNQIDNLREQDVDVVVRDVSQVLADDGLGGVEILTASALTGEGVADVREFLARALVRPTTSSATLDAGIDRLAAQLGDQVAARSVALPADDAVGAHLSRAVGTEAAADSVRTAVRSGGAAARPEPVRPVAVEDVRTDWLAEVTGGLPGRWSSAVDDSVTAAPDLARSVDTAVAEVPLPATDVPRARGLQIGGAVALALAVVVVVLGLVLDLPTIAWIVVAVVLAGVGAYLLLSAPRVRAAAAQERADEYSRELETRLRAVGRSGLREPAEQVLEDHEALRAALG
ncbi:GTPase [Georgenia sp. Z1491]|uniref:GTPase n=1 Tax=Georgenia sp. Z1491 TaxID=3416707 RepID=UPI003CF05F96